MAASQGKQVYFPFNSKRLCIRDERVRRRAFVSLPEENAAPSLPEEPVALDTDFE